MRHPQVRTRPEELDELVPAWRELAWGTAGSSYFSSPEWVLSWWETIGRGIDGRVAVWHDDDGLSAVVPLGVVRQRLHPGIPLAVRCLTNLGSGTGSADHCGFAVSPRAVPDVRDWLAAVGRRSTLLLQDLDPEPAATLHPVRARQVGASRCPRLAIPADLGDIGGSSGFRKQLRGYLRRLTREGVTFRWVAPGDVDPTLLDTLFALHATRSETAGRSSTFGADRRPLHQLLVASGAPGRGPAVVVAERDGEPIGMLYGFRWRDEFAYYQSGWRPEMAQLSLGTVLVAAAIGLAAADGARVFDFLRGAEPYKYRFGAVDRTDTTWLLPRGASGAALGLKYRAKGRRSPAAAPAGSGVPVPG